MRKPVGPKCSVVKDVHGIFHALDLPRSVVVLLPADNLYHYNVLRTWADKYCAARNKGWGEHRAPGYRDY